jgi:predicted RNA-binding Zn ribbon-like protein
MIASVNELKNWLDGHGLSTDQSMGQRDLGRALAVREGIRALLLANNAQVPNLTAIAKMNRVSERYRFGFSFSPGATSLNAVPSSGIDRLLLILFATMHELMVNGTWPTYKACRNSGCQWAFVDRSRNQSRRWCEMSACGNQSKSRAFAKRRRSEELIGD